MVMVLLSACGDDDGSTPPTQLETPGEIIGRVEVAEDVPLGNCQVLLEGAPLGARCDASGQFDIRNVPPGRWDMRLVPDPDGRGLPARRVAAASNSGFVTDVGALRLAPAGAVGGHIVNAAGAPPFAIISVPAYGVVTAPNENGGYLLERVPPGVHDVVLTTDSGLVIKSNVTVLPGKPTIGVNFDLQQMQQVSATLTGQARRLENGVLATFQAAADQAGMTVELVEARDGQVVATTTTDASGRYSLQAPQGAYILRLRDGQRQVTAVVPYVLVYKNGLVEVPQQLTLPPDQADIDGDDVVGDADMDDDGDGTPDATDAFPQDPAETTDADSDGVGDHADLKTTSDTVDDHTPTPDTDGDGMLDFEDNCVDDINPMQEDPDADGVGSACDNCPFVANPDQQDSLQNGEGDACRTCIQGDPCAPANPCHVGFLTCTSGGPVCADSGVNLPNGDPCGTDMYCSAGTCTACMAGDTCAVPGNPCVQGVTECSTGQPLCTATMVDVADGTPCGAGQVCKDGSCVPCNTGASCSPAGDPCHEGMVLCSSGDPVCMATATAVADGTSCGTDLVCSAGACVTCQSGAACTPANVCHTGTVQCSSGQPVCVDQGGAANDGMPCGGMAGFGCQAGSCVMLVDTLTVSPGVDGQTGFVTALLPTPFTVTLKDGGGQPIVGRLVTFTAPAGGVVSPTSVNTGTGGVAQATMRLPPTAGSYDFTATTSGAAPVTITVTATTAGTTGTMATFVNIDHVTSGGEGLNGPAISAHINNPSGIAVASDGTVYFVENAVHKVKKVSPTGIITLVAGTGSPGSAGDNGPATAAQLSFPTAVALDEVGGVLYVADRSNNKIRVVNLGTGIITTYAGGGPANAADPYGDGTPALNATLSAPDYIAVHPADRSLYITDTGHSRVRRVDRVSSIVTTVVDTSGSCSTDEVRLLSCSLSNPCALAFDGGGRLFVSGGICGISPNSASAVNGIMRRDLDGSLHHVAGMQNGTASENVPATAAGIGAASDLAFDQAGNLFFVDTSASVNKVRRIDGSTGLITTVAGNGTSNTAAEFVTASTAPLNDPQNLAFLPNGDLLLSEAGSDSIRRLFATGATVATPILLALDSGSNQATEVARTFPAPLIAKVTSSGNPVPGAKVAFEAVNPALATPGSPAATTPAGQAVLSARAPLKPGTYVVNARLRNIHGVEVGGSPVAFNLTVNAPAADLIYTAVNVEHTAGFTGMGGPATMARVNDARGIVVASDGTIYFSDFTRVYRSTPDGVITVIAGTGLTAFNGEFGQGTLINLTNPSSLALDEAGGILYINEARSNDSRIRALNLATGDIYKYAGGGSATGDGGPATSARLDNIMDLAFDPTTGALVYIDIGLSGGPNHRVRRIDPLAPIGSGSYSPGAAGGTVSTIPLTTGTCISGTLTYSSCGNDCAVAFDPVGNLYIAGVFCGTDLMSQNPTTSIVRRTPAGALTLIVGRYIATASGDGLAATATSLNSLTVSGLALDGDILYWSQVNNAPHSRVRGVDVSLGAAATVFPVAGTSLEGFNGDYQPATNATLDHPEGIAVQNGHLYIVDRDNACVRVVQ